MGAGHRLGVSSEEVDSMARLYEAHAAAIHAYALRRSDRETADEVTARVFLIAWRRRESVPAEPLPWLYGVARRVLSEERRGAARRGALRERLSRSDAHRPAELPELGDVELAAALARLSSMDREALLLALLGGASARAGGHRARMLEGNARGAVAQSEGPSSTDAR
jgi:DNA-directed RNA polymerase specialized sigma24 family protein